jgi:histidyl-tRNA synthetase
MLKPNIDQFIQKPPFEETFSYKGPLSKSINTARHYGFRLIEPVPINKRLPITLSRSKKESLKGRDFSDFPKDYMSTLKKYIDEEMYKFAQPIMFCHVTNKNKNWSELRLEVIGTKKSVAEATVIKTASIILEDLGYKNMRIKLNSMGDRESGNNFVKELTNYYREHISNFSPTFQQQLKKDILKIYSNISEKHKEINESAPKPISFLSEDSRAHFKEIIEFIENLEMDYEIENSLVGNSFCLPVTLYEIIGSDIRNSEQILAQGERHNYLAQNIGYNKKVPMVGIRINIKKENRKKETYTIKTSKQNPKVFLIHLGFDAKKKGLNILEIFRKSKVPVHQSLCNDSFAYQLRSAQDTGVPYTIIMGQKEVLNNSIIFRNMETRYQENVSLPQLEGFLTNLKRKKVL